MVFPELAYGLILQNRCGKSGNLYWRVIGQPIQYSLEKCEYRNADNRVIPKPTDTEIIGRQ